MPVMPAQAAVDSRRDADRRPAFHLRLPTIATDDPPATPLAPPPTMASGELPRGMQVLNRILNRLPRQRKPRRRLRRWQKRLGIVALCLTCLSCLTLALGLTFDDDFAVEVSDFNADLPEEARDFSSPSSSATPAAAANRPQIAASRTVPAGGERPRGSAVESAVYQTMQSTPSSGVWLEGIDDSDEP
ncbi:MAG: hypothetical protein EXS05_13270 [Planctomycetaceae bacterium]|nr:hypothetical protein [Planctomycetaceae bacterium]